jgi:hypothetical protein
VEKGDADESCGHHAQFLRVDPEESPAPRTRPAILNPTKDGVSGRGVDGLAATAIVSRIASCAVTEIVGSRDPTAIVIEVLLPDVALQPISICGITGSGHKANRDRTI